MSAVQDYASSLSDVSSRKFETFSYLPAMDDANIRKQVQYIVNKGWNPAISSRSHALRGNAGLAAPAARLRTRRRGLGAKRRLGAEAPGHPDPYQRDLRHE